MIEPMPTITSFIIRFVHSETGPEAPSYRGTIRHIPSHQEIHFNRWAEAEDFMRRFVPLESTGTAALSGDPDQVDEPM
jgi:hypothetical protein